MAHQKQFPIGKLPKCKFKNSSAATEIGAIFLVRNPWNAFFSEWQRTRNASLNGHVYNALQSDFDPKFERGGLIKGYANQWVETLKIYEQFQELGRDVLLVIFENLHNDIWKVLEFLFAEKYLQENKVTYERKLRCITDKITPLPRNEFIRRLKVSNYSRYLSKNQFYSKMSQKVMCDIWRVMKDYVDKYDLQRWGYSQLIRGYHCF